MSAWRVALRIAAREARRSKGRSALVVAMIGVPMLALSFADVAVRTGQLPRTEVARRELGTADLVVSVVSAGPIEQHGPYGFSSDDPVTAPGPAPDVARLLPPGSRVAPRTTLGAVAVEAAGRAVYGEVEQADLHDPLADGVVRVRKGTVPRAPGEAALSERAARDLGAGPGDTVTVAGRPFRVTGVVLAPSDLSAQRVYVPAAAALPESGNPHAVMRSWAVDLPDGVSGASLVPALNRHGLLVRPRAWVLDPPPDDLGGGHTDSAGIGAVVLVAGLAALEIVLLAGTAFAVGARRRRRELALIAATGGDRKDVRRVVLAGAVVLGGIAGAAGVTGGILAVVLLRPVLGRLSGSLLGPLDLRPLELGGIVLLATGTALVAALLPARAASRFPVIAGLTGRRGETRLRKRVPVAGLVAVAAGTGVAFWAARRAFEPTRVAEDVVMYQPGNDLVFVMAGAAVAELGFVACAPAVVSLLGRVAGRLPLSLRLAARDAARHRSRTGPAVAAVVAAVAGSVAISVYAASENEQARRAYEPFLPMGAARIGTELPDGRRVPVAAVDAAVAALPARERVDTFSVGAPCTKDPCAAWTIELPEEYECAETDLACLRAAPRPGEIKAGPEGLVEVATGGRDAAAVGALRAGRAVVFDARWVRDGTVTLSLVAGGEARVLRTVRVPATALAAERLGEAPAVVLTPDTARRHGLPLMRSTTFVLTTKEPTGAEQAAATAALVGAGPYAEFWVERGFESETSLELLALALAAGFVTLAATGIATGLAAADSRPDLATLAAVGAAPRVRRRLVMAQAATVAVAGSLLGVLAGLVPAVAIVSGQADFPLVLPWQVFAVTVVGVPVLVAVVLGLLTRSRLPLERRLV